MNVIILSNVINFAKFVKIPVFPSLSDSFTQLKCNIKPRVFIGNLVTIFRIYDVVFGLVGLTFSPLIIRRRKHFLEQRDCNAVSSI